MLGTFTWDGSDRLRCGCNRVGKPADQEVEHTDTRGREEAIAIPDELLGLRRLGRARLSCPATAQADRLYIKGLNLTGTSVQVETTGFTTSQVMVYDVRDPRHPVVIGGTQATGVGAPYKLTFWDAWAAGAPATSYFLTTQAALISPATPVTPVAVEIASLPGWNTLAQQLRLHRHRPPFAVGRHSAPVDHRTAQGLRVAKVDVQDIYDAYSGGLVDRRQSAVSWRTLTATGMAAAADQAARPAEICAAGRRRPLRLQGRHLATGLSST